MDNNTVYSITLADGTVIENLTMNGDNFVSADGVDSAVFTDNCSPVIISDGETEVTHEHMELVQVTEAPDDSETTWFVLRDLTEAEIEKMQTRADIEYLAMMAGVEL